MRKLLWALLPVALLAHGYKMVITLNSGETVEYTTEEIKEIEFIEDQPAVDPVQLPTPEVSVSVSGSMVNVSWNAVANAVGYEYYVDNEDPVETSKTSVQLEAQTGAHSIYVVALGDGRNYTDSYAGLGTYSFNARIDITVDETTSSSVKVTYVPTPSTLEYYCAVIPSSLITSDADVVAYFQKHSEIEKRAGGYTFTATGLEASTNYVVVAYVTSDNGNVFSKTVRTNSDENFQPGDSGSVFAYGTDLNSGWIDVDKVYANASNIWPGANDTLMCWACSTAACIQYWLNEYKAEFGAYPEMKYTIPEKSDYYTTPIMDIMVTQFPNDAYDAKWAFEWFCKHDSQATTRQNNEHYTYNQDSPYLYGGFLQKDINFVNKYCQKYTAWELFPTTDPADKIEETFNNLIFDLLDQGVVEITIRNGGHSMVCWGVDYIVKDNGKRKAVRMYIGENETANSINVKNGLNRADITYVKGDVMLTGFANLSSMTVFRSPRVEKIK